MIVKQFSDGFWVIFSARLYQGLIFTLPKEFRQNYAAEMSRVFRDCCRYAYEHRGIFGVLSELIASVFDLITNAFKERVMTLLNDNRRLSFLLITGILAASGGLFAAFADLRKEEVPGPVFMVVIFTFVLGFFRPSCFWFSGLIVGLMMPMIHFIARVKGWEIAYPNDDSTPIWSFWILIPALLGSILGAVFRWCLNRIRNRY